MTKYVNESCLVEPVWCDGDWGDVIAAADAAGRLAAREFAARCSVWELGRTGKVWVYVEPLASPVATWLCQRGCAERGPDEDGVRVPITVAPEGLRQDQAERKACSQLVRRAYAAAYCTVLAEEAGVTATPVLESGVGVPVPRSSSDAESVSPEENWMIADRS